MKKLIIVLALVAVLSVPAVVSAAGSVSADIPLQAGWNMVSVPLVPDDASPAAVFPGCQVYAWDAIAKGYVNVPIDPSLGYWVWSPTTQVITVTGEPYSG